MTAVPPEGSGDFAEYAATTWPRLVRIAHMLTGDFHEAEDLVQTTLTKVYARWRHIPRAEVGVYMRRALVNNNISRLRKKRVVHLLMPFLPESGADSGPGSGSGPYARTGTEAGNGEAVERRVALHQALAALSPRQRAVMVLRYYDDLGDEDIARVLNCSPGTVKTHARRGLAALRAHPALCDSEFLGAHR